MVSISKAGLIQKAYSPKVDENKHAKHRAVASGIVAGSLGANVGHAVSKSIKSKSGKAALIGGGIGALGGIVRGYSKGKNRAKAHNKKVDVARAIVGSKSFKDLK
jgi:hypothetical protein